MTTTDRRERLQELYDDAAAERIMALEDENDALRQRLEEMTATTFSVPGMTASHMVILSLLYRRQGVVSREALHGALYALDPGEGAEMKIIDVFICKIRKQLAPLGVEIESRWGQGYELTPEGREKLSRYEVGVQA